MVIVYCRKPKENQPNAPVSAKAVQQPVATFSVPTSTNSIVTHDTITRAQSTVVRPTTQVSITVNRTPVVHTTPKVTSQPISSAPSTPSGLRKPATSKPISTHFATSKSNAALAPYRLVRVTEVPYKSPSDRTITYYGKRRISFNHKSMDSIIKRNGRDKLTYNIDASFKQSHYFVFPNIKGLCNRLQLFAGIYILSSYFRIPIILSKSMGWKQFWDMTEMFPGQLIEVPDRGMFFFNSINNRDL